MPQIIENHEEWSWRCFVEPGCYLLRLKVAKRRYPSKGVAGKPAQRELGAGFVRHLRADIDANSTTWEGVVEFSRQLHCQVCLADTTHPLEGFACDVHMLPRGQVCKQGVN